MPLDLFFRSFPTYNYDPSLPPATSFAKLQRHKGWRGGEAASERGWERYQDALAGELHMWYGAEDDLSAWHALCRAIGVSPLPNTCERCEQAARRTHVNIIDLIDSGRNGGTRVRTFRSVAELREYCRSTHKIFLHNKGEVRNTVLKYLLRTLFP